LVKTRARGASEGNNRGAVLSDRYESDASAADDGLEPFVELAFLSA